jgi:hypothetical protein
MTNETNPTSAGTRVALSDTFELPLERRAAFRLFTARGEELWVPGWEPRFPVPAADDLEVGTVWLTRDDGGRTTAWVVLDCDPGVRVRYARVAEGWTAGTVTVRLADASEGCRVTVDYDLTALHADAAAELARFADDYTAYLGTWRQAILDHVVSGGRLPDAVRDPGRLSEVDGRL